MFRKSILKAKRSRRKLEYVSFKDFINKSDYLLDDTNLIWYSGNYSIPSHSLFYNNILIKNNIDILDDKKVINFFLSKQGKFETSSQFTKIYIVPVRKYLRKQKVFDKLLFKLLVRVKVFDKNQFIKLTNIDNISYQKALYHLSCVN